MGRLKALVCCTAMALLAVGGARAGVMNPIPGDPIDFVERHPYQFQQGA